MCSGKSRVGQILSEKIKWPYYDTDKMIEKIVGHPVGDIIRKQGEAAFRLVEKNAVELLSTLDNVVISTGGGVPLDPQNMAALSEKGVLVWLQVSPASVLKRAGDLKSRPLIDSKNPLESVRQKLSEREKFYQTAKYFVSTDDDTPESIADKIIQLCQVQVT